jgi:hypothetical protein
MVSIYWKTFFGSTVRCNAMFISRILSCSDQMRIAVNASVQLIAVSHHNEPSHPGSDRGTSCSRIKTSQSHSQPTNVAKNTCRSSQRDGSEVAQKRSPRRACDGHAVTRSCILKIVRSPSYVRLFFFFCFSFQRFISLCVYLFFFHSFCFYFY